MIHPRQDKTRQTNYAWVKTGFVKNVFVVFLLSAIFLNLQSAFAYTTNMSASVEIGQPDFIHNSANQGGNVAANTLDLPEEVVLNGGKVITADRNNNRVLIYNSIPTLNNVSADVVIGQQNFTSKTANQGLSVAANTLNQPNGLSSKGSRLIIADTGNNRVLIYNSISTSNNTSADVVVGQSNFTSSSANQGVSTAANTLNSPYGVTSDGKRLFIADQSNHRILVFNQIPSSNNPSADMVIGQPDFTSNLGFQSGSTTSPTQNSFWAPRGIDIEDNKMVVADLIGRRVLIFNNLIKQPGLTLNNSPEGRENNQLRLKGTATVDSPYTVKNVEFSVNGGSFSGATATDGGFDETSEEYYFDFTPTSNQPKDSNGNLIDGYTVRVKSTNNNTDVTDRLFYFSPFDLQIPVDNTTLTTSYPSFEFSVNKQQLNLQDALSKYQVQVRKGGSDSTANWETLIDEIPVDFRSVKNERTNKQWEVWGHLDTNNGVYETDKFYATYSDESSRVKVYSKTNSMSGTYQWKIVAVDKSGHNQETGARNLFVSTTATTTTNYFPLAVLNISGLGNPYLNSYNLSNIKSTYYASSSNPIFYGIAWTNSKVTLKLTDQNCPSTSSGSTNCTKTYSTTANAESRYGINVPKGDLSYGKKYTTNLSVSLEDKYNELPQFTLSIGGLSSPSTITTTTSEENNTETKEDKEISPSSSPEPSPTTEETPESSNQLQADKRCIWFICW